MKPRVLIVDNYDSFTYNIVQALGTLGAAIEVVRADRVGVDDVNANLPQGLLISPGPGKPEDAGASVGLVRALSGRIPILGICLGHQAIAAAFGGSVVRSTATHGKCSVIRHDGNRLFDRVPSPLRATRYHSLTVAEESLRGTPLRVCAHTTEQVVMGIAHVSDHTYGVQFHPESVMSEHGRHIFSNFLNIAGAAA
jgi:anthranilate synthase/aminodeoxychorismate synthase-like glutamine amidotransferase